MMLTFVFTMLFLSCKNERNKDDNRKYINNSEIIGEWILASHQLNYPTLVFNKDSTAIFTSRGDTVYRYRYYIKESNLVLNDIQNSISKNEILKLSDDSLIVKKLVVNEGMQVYVRKH